METITMEEVRRALREDGFYCVDDPAVGLRVQEMEEAAAQFTSSRREGWDFCDQHILNNALVVTTLESTYKFCRLGDYRRIAADPGHVFQFRKGNKGPDIVLIQLWGKRKGAVYFPGSHRVLPRSFRAANRLWEVVQADLTRAGLRGEEKIFDEGGLVILDARLSLEMPNGDPVTAAFVGSDDRNSVIAELEKWRKIEIPNLGAQAISDLDERTIGVHYTIRRQG